MSGIAGIYNLSGAPVCAGDLALMVGSMKRRGPDGSGVWSEGAVGLGQCMLWTTPESLHEKLPFTNVDSGLTITADARIDNRTDLLGSLGLAMGASGQISDSELILASYEKWGEDCPTKLIGDFAFAIWDRRRQILFCARDHFGVRPFNYYKSDQLFVLASEIKALLSFSTVPKRINEARIADYLVDELEGIDKTCTFYNGILRLPPSHSLTIGPNKMSLRCYWSLDQAREIHFRSDSEYAEAFLDTFTKAVRCRLRSAFPMGSMLSGGLDSSSIVAVARDLPSTGGRNRLHTFSAVSHDRERCTETHFIRRMISLGGIQAHTVRPDQLNSFASALDYVPWHTDDLFDNVMIIPQIMYILAHKEGVKSLIDGIDGDLVASQSTGYLAYILKDGRWQTAFSEAAGLSDHFYRKYYSTWKLFYLNARRAFVPESVRKYRRRIIKRNSLNNAIRGSIINVEFARRIGLRDRLEMLNGPKGMFGTLREDHVNILNSPYVTVAMERYDRVASAYSIESRHPFFDKRVVELCLALPSEQKISNGWSKTVLRRAMKGILPDDIRWRKGWDHLGWDFLAAVLSLQQDLLRKVISNYLQYIGDYVNVTAVHEAYQRHSIHKSILDGNKVWEAVTLSLWLERNVMR